MATADSAEANPPAVVRATPGGMLTAFNRYIFPIVAAVVLMMALGTGAMVFLVSTPFRTGTPPPLPADVTDEYRVYSFYKRDMYDLYIQSENKSLAVHALQVGIGTVLGLLCVFMGTAMCWFGVTGAFAIDAADGTRKLNLQSAQVGTILLVGGIVLVSIAIIKTNDVIDTGGLAASAPKAGTPPFGSSAPSGGMGEGMGGMGIYSGTLAERPPVMTNKEQARLQQGSAK